MDTTEGLTPAMLLEQEKVFEEQKVIEWTLALHAIGVFLVHANKYLDLDPGRDFFTGTYNPNAELGKFLARNGHQLVPITPEA